MVEKRPRAFYLLAAFFAAYVLFLYGPMIAIYILSFQGPDGGLTFPMNGVSLVWFGKVFSGSGIRASSAWRTSRSQASRGFSACFHRSSLHRSPRGVPKTESSAGGAARLADVAAAGDPVNRP